MTGGVILMAAGALIACIVPAHDIVSAWRWHQRSNRQR
ncbi:hypothetical protein GGQ80_000774 [Sphingomonas jinjuensis]|uniref:Uncharacterized protein n=1 Tax=Sphingomonas jinjuensis TaxID=535907 RepID=A0A840F9B4_9SPHN|nr:hypothetical protein [Sphingomonas jinjuensis]